MRALWSCFCVLFTSVVTQLNERQAEVQENCLRTLLQSRKEKKNRSAMMTVRDPSSIKKQNIRGISFICSSYEIPSCSHIYKDTRPSKGVKKKKP